eukprot:jgi/Picsp_1/4095/NSC_01605-R1_---NA---
MTRKRCKYLVARPASASSEYRVGMPLDQSLILCIQRMLVNQWAPQGATGDLLSRHVHQQPSLFIQRHFDFFSIVKMHKRCSGRSMEFKYRSKVVCLFSWPKYSNALTNQSIAVHMGSHCLVWAILSLCMYFFPLQIVFY